MGSNGKDANKVDGEEPIRKITVDSFYMDVTSVTIRDFEQFIKDIGYVTEAEVFGRSFLFHTLLVKK